MRLDESSTPGDTAVASTPPGVSDPPRTHLSPDEEPVVTGTLFLTLILLMIIAGFWVIIYQRLITS